jgi:pSer/pThr/pTyr-binding forkhead associated (FHA) protein
MQSASETKWTVVRGPMKGVIRLMNLPQFSIGRSTECEFVIVNDPKCSRKQAVITMSPQGCEISSQADNNPPLVNGKEVQRQLLKDGDVITLGETDIQYNTTVKPMIAVVRNDPYNAAHTVLGGHPAKRKPKPASAISGRLVIYAVLGIALLFMLAPTKSKKKTIDLRTEQQIQADIETATKLKEVADAASVKRLDGSMNSRQAQENYIRGFRDYKKGQYERGLVSFQACLALNPEHVLCNRYIRLAQRRFDELIQVQMIMARQYRDQNQYQACRSVFRNVMQMLKDTNNAIYKEARANYEACNAFVEGRF